MTLIPNTISCDICGAPVPTTDIHTNADDQTICRTCATKGTDTTDVQPPNIPQTTEARNARAARHIAAADVIEEAERDLGLAGGGGAPHREAAALWLEAAAGSPEAALSALALELQHGITRTGEGEDSQNAEFGQFLRRVQTSTDTELEKIDLLPAEVWVGATVWNGELALLVAGETMVACREALNETRANIGIPDGDGQDDLQPEKVRKGTQTDEPTPHIWIADPPQVRWINKDDGPMGMITINKVTVVGYTALIDGNNGEEQLVITQSGGQGGHVALISRQGPSRWWRNGAGRSGTQEPQSTQMGRGGESHRRNPADVGWGELLGS